MSFTRAVVLGGVTVAFLDGLDAVVFAEIRGANWSRVFQSVASGLIGPSAYRGGLPTALLGVALHVIIAGIVVGALCFVQVRFRVLGRGWVWLGAAYGLCVYAFMNGVVVPISAAEFGTPDAAVLLNGIGVHILGVGVPAAWFARSVKTFPLGTDDGSAVDRPGESDAYR